jgi:3'(2'), 5'-bisphosphate nucleotidase
MLWDTCATEALVRAAGGELTDEEGAPLGYAGPELAHSRGLVATNGKVHAALIEAMKRCARGAQGT